jgi:hypothetical protein
MLQCAVRGVVLALLVLALVCVSCPAQAASSSEPILEHLVDGGPAFSFGLGVAPLRWSLAPIVPATPGPPVGESARLAELDAQGSSMSFDFKLRWPGAELVPSLEPYVAVGPALFMVEPDYAGRLLGTRVDPTYHVGAKAAAGVNWRLGKRATLFGEYEITTARPGALATTGAGTAGDGGVGGFDFTYGLRLRY